jgi:hypothetical protein
MSTVLQFRTPTRSGAAQAPLSGPCEIVIFPGVRIERHAEPQSSTTDAIAIEARDVSDGAPVSRAN